MNLPAVTSPVSRLQAENLLDFGLAARDPAGIIGRLHFERPGWVFAHRLKNCSLGAFSYLNAAGSTSAYRCRIGRYCQIGESSILGPPEHPMDWFSTHPFVFGRPEHMPSFYQQAEFSRLAPDSSDEPGWAEQVPNETIIGHEAYAGAGTFVRRGVKIGHGAVVGARSVVTRDVAPYTIAAGNPARVIRLRFSEPLVERLLALQWWLYDLAPYKRQVDFAQVEETLDFFETRKATGELKPLVPETFSVERGEDGFTLDARLPLYSDKDGYQS